MNVGSTANEMMQYSLLCLLARGRAISQAGLAFLERLALRDGRMDADERLILGRILDEIDAVGSDPAVHAQITRMRTEYSLDRKTDEDRRAARVA